MIDSLVRPHLLTLKPYSSARDEFYSSSPAGNDLRDKKSYIWLDANESPSCPINHPSVVNRYPDPHHREIKAALSLQKKIPPENILLGNGSDELIDLIVRLVGVPGQDSILIHPPTYGMYRVVAESHDIKVVEAPLREDFSLDKQSFTAAFASSPKITFLCSPNNPTGNCLSKSDIEWVVGHAPGLIVIDEAYIDFKKDASFLPFVTSTDRLVILQTFSKAWGCAGARAGVLYGCSRIVELLTKIKPPYNINCLTQDLILRALSQPEWRLRNVDTILTQKKKLIENLEKSREVKRVLSSDTNFFLVECHDRDKAYQVLLDHSIVARKPSGTLLSSMLRITVGSQEENEFLTTVFSSIS